MEIDDNVRQREQRVRRHITRTALWTTPLFVVLAGSWIFFLWDILAEKEIFATWFFMVILTVFVIIFGVQSIAALRDLLGKPLEERGTVLRKWTKRDSFVWKSYYIRVGRRILRGDEGVLDGIVAGDLIDVRFYAHSGLVIAARQVETAKPEQPEEDPDLPLPSATPGRPRGTATRPEF